MSIKICGYPFDGPYYNTDAIENKSGVYIILDEQQNKFSVIDVGEFVFGDQGQES